MTNGRLMLTFEPDDETNGEVNNDKFRDLNNNLIGAWKVRFMFPAVPGADVRLLVWVVVWFANGRVNVAVIVGMVARFQRRKPSLRLVGFWFVAIGHREVVKSQFNSLTRFDEDSPRARLCALHGGLTGITGQVTFIQVSDADGVAVCAASAF